MVTLARFIAIAALAAGLPAALASSAFHGPPSAFVSSSRWASLSLPNRRGTSCHVVTSTSAAATPPSKGDMYDDEELFDLLTLHQSLNPEPEKGLFSGGQEENLNEASIAGGIHEWVLEALEEGDYYPTNGIGQAGASAIPGLHELVLETIEDIESASSSSEEDDAPINQLAFDNLQSLLRDKKPAIRAIATDVDGTLLAGQDLHPTTLEAVLKAIDHAESDACKIQHFFPATGKSRKGAMISLGETLGPLLYELPGVYIQGLYCIDGEGNVLFEKKLPSSTVRAAEELARDCGISIMGYDGDDLYTTYQSEAIVSLSEIYGEPPVELIVDDDGSVVKLADHGPGMHKLLLMDFDVDRLANEVRPKLEVLAKEYDATVTQAVPTMLEILPAGCSKAFGVAKVCEALGVDVAEELLALGDAENDVDMLRNAAIGVAVGNACPHAKDAADFIMRERHDEGGAGLAMNLFAFDS